MRSILSNDHRSFQSPSVWVPLFEVALDDQTLYLTPSSTALTADGHEYQPFPIMLEEIRDDGKGDVNTINLTCSDIEGTLGTKIKQIGSLDGYSLIFKIYSVELESVVYEESLEILKTGPITEQTVSLELGMFNPFTVKLLVEKYLKDFCWNRYKGRGCWITKSDGTFLQPSGFTVGSPDTCTHKMVDCVRHTNTTRINSCPGIPGGGGFV